MTINRSSWVRSWEDQHSLGPIWSSAAWAAHESCVLTSDEALEAAICVLTVEKDNSKSKVVAASTVCWTLLPALEWSSH